MCVAVEAKQRAVIEAFIWRYLKFITEKRKKIYTYDANEDVEFITIPFFRL